MTDPSDLNPARELDYDNIFIEPHRLQQGEAFVSEEALLDGLPVDERGEAVEHAARLLSAINVAIFGSEVGTMYATSLDCTFASGEEKTIVVFGERTEEGVQCEIGLIDTDKVSGILHDDEEIL